MPLINDVNLYQLTNNCTQPTPISRPTLPLISSHAYRLGVQNCNLFPNLPNPNVKKNEFFLHLPLNPSITTSSKLKKINKNKTVPPKKTAINPKQANHKIMQSVDIFRINKNIKFGHNYRHTKIISFSKILNCSLML